MTSAFGKIAGTVLLAGLTIMLWRLLRWVYCSFRQSPISGPAALGKAIGFAAVGGPFIEMCLVIYAGALSENYEDSVVFLGVALLIVLASAYVSGRLAAHTYEKMVFMNAGLNAVLGGITRTPALFVLGALRPPFLTWLSFGLFFPGAIVGAYHCFRQRPHSLFGNTNDGMDAGA